MTKHNELWLNGATGNYELLARDSPLIVGSDPLAKIRIFHRQIKRRHARLTHIGNNYWEIEPLDGEVYDDDGRIDRKVRIFVGTSISFHHSLTFIVEDTNPNAKTTVASALYPPSSTPVPHSPPAPSSHRSSPLPPKPVSPPSPPTPGSAGGTSSFTSSSKTVPTKPLGFPLPPNFSSKGTPSVEGEIDNFSQKEEMEPTNYLLLSLKVFVCMTIGSVIFIIKFGWAAENTFKSKDNRNNSRTSDSWLSQYRFNDQPRAITVGIARIEIGGGRKVLVRIEDSDLIASSMDIGDKVSIWGRERHGVILMKIGYNHTTKSPIILRKRKRGFAP